MTEVVPRGRRRGGVRGVTRRRTVTRDESEALRRFRARYPFPLDSFQLQAIAALESRQSVLASAPTGTGKTVIAEFGIELAREQGLRVIYTSPIKALSNQKFRDWRAQYGDAVGLLTGDVTQNPDGSIMVMTTEVLRNMLLESAQSLDDVGVVIFDEVHFLADPDRGTTWEESILYCPKHVQLVCLSATASNAEEIATWISHVHRETVLVTHAERAVPLEHYYFLDGDLHQMLDAAGAALEPLRTGGEARHPKPAGIPAGARPRDVPRPNEVVRVLNGAGMLPAIYFLFSRRACEAAAMDCQGLDLLGSREARQARQGRINAYLELLAWEDRQLDQVQRLMGLLRHGIAFHHAGLLPLLKNLVEELFAAGLIGVVFATETLALGINMPARSVVIAEQTKFDGESRRFLLTNEYSQLVGRAGRRGLDPKGYAIALYSPWVSYGETLEMLTGDLLPIRSAFTPRYNTLVSLWDGTAVARDRLVRLFSSSLRQFQMNDELKTAATEVEALRQRAAAARFACPYEGIPDDAVVHYSGLRRQLSDAKKSAQRAQLRAATARRRHLPVAPDVSPAGDVAGVPFVPDANILLEASEMPVVGDEAEVPDLPSAGAGAETPEAPLASGMAESERLKQVPAHARHELQSTAGREATAQAELAALQAEVEAHPCHLCPVRHEHERALKRERAAVRELADAEHYTSELESAAASQAERTLASLTMVLHRFGFLVDAARGAAPRPVGAPTNGDASSVAPTSPDSPAVDVTMVASGTAAVDKAGVVDDSVASPVRQPPARRKGASSGVLIPTEKAAVLKGVYDSNGVLLLNLAWDGHFDTLAPAELMELISWFCYDREGPRWNRHQLSSRMWELRTVIGQHLSAVQQAEARAEISITNGPNADYFGPVLAWCRGASFSELLEKMPVGEGDQLQALYKTLDLAAQLREALRDGASTSLDARRLAAKLEVGDGLLRRGIVAQSLRLAAGLPVAGPEATDSTAVASSAASSPAAATRAAAAAPAFSSSAINRRPSTLRAP